MFEFPVLDEATLQAVREIGAERAVYRRKEALQLYYTLSRDFRDAFSRLEIFVLKPVCVSCANQRAFGWSSRKPTLVSVLPGYRPQQLRMYDLANNVLHFFEYDRAEDEERFRITCTHCGDYADEGNEGGDELVLVEPESFCEYFGIEDEGPKRPTGDLREEDPGAVWPCVLCVRCDGADHGRSHHAEEYRRPGYSYEPSVTV